MQLKAIGQLLARVGTAFIVAGGVVALSAAGPANAAAITVSNHSLSGLDFYVACLTSAKCIATGENDSGHATITPTNNGAPGKTATVNSQGGIDAISCPSSSGCWALSQNRIGKALLIKISSAGGVAKIKTETLPAHVTLSAISCTSLTSCGVGGQNDHAVPGTIEIGTWNGSKLSLHGVTGPHGSTDLVYAMSCYRTYCAAVGYSNIGTRTDAFVLTSSHGKPGKVHTLAKSEFTGVSCISTSTCYADGNRAPGAGIVATISRGVPSHVHGTGSAHLFGIACNGTICAASGEVGTGTVVGVLYFTSSGAITGSPVDESAIEGYNDVASRGSGDDFAAIGPGQISGSILSIIS